MALRRILGEQRTFKAAEDMSWAACGFEDLDNLFKVRLAVTPRDDSPWRGYWFEACIEMKSDYPFSAPQLTWLTRLNGHPMFVGIEKCHCDCYFCHCGIGRDQWSPALTVVHILNMMRDFFSPRFYESRDDYPPGNKGLVRTMRDNKKSFESEARESAAKYGLKGKPVYLQAKEVKK
jgi:ubiquitin-protein ligase